MTNKPSYDDLPDLFHVDFDDKVSTDLNGLLTHLRGVENIGQDFLYDNWDNINSRFSDGEDNETFHEEISFPPKYFKNGHDSSCLKGEEVASTTKQQKTNDYNNSIPLSRFWTTLSMDAPFVSSSSSRVGPPPGLDMRFGETNSASLSPPKVVSPVSPDEPPCDPENTISFLPQDFFIYPDKMHHMEYERVKYYIEAAQGKVLQKSYFFDVSLLDPDNVTSHLALNSDNVNSGRHFCTFVPFKAGVYIVSFTLTNDDKSHIRGSPVHLQVSRNYLEARRCNLMTLGLKPNSQFLLKPWGIGVYRPKNHIYLTDRDRHHVLVVDLQGTVVKKFGEFGQGRGQLYRPTGVAVDEVNRRVIITDKDNHRISIYSLEGHHQTSFGSRGHQNGQFNYPWGVAVSKQGTIAVADSRNHRIQLFDKSGRYLRKYSVFEVNPFAYKGQFQSPRGVAFDEEGANIFVTDFDIDSVLKLDVGCTKKSVLVAQGLLDRPQGVAVDLTGNVLVCDSKNNLVRVFGCSRGNLLSNIESTGKCAIKGPFNVAVLSGGKVAVVDSVGMLRVF